MINGSTKDHCERFTDPFKIKFTAQMTTSAAATTEQKMAIAIARTPARKIIATHQVVDTDTLSGIALNYYDSAVREYWMVIYEYNKGVIGNNPGVIHPGNNL